MRTTIGTTLVWPIGAAESLDVLATAGVDVVCRPWRQPTDANPTPPRTEPARARRQLSPAELDAGTVTCTVALPPAGTNSRDGEVLPPSDVPRSMAVKTTLPA